MAKWLSVRLHTKWLRVRISLLSLKLQICPLLQARNSLPSRQTIGCRFPLKLVSDPIKTYSQKHRTDKYWRDGSIIWPVWLNSSEIVYVLSDCVFEYRCCHFNFRYGACFNKAVPEIQANYLAWIHDENLTWYDNKIQSNAPHIWLLTAQLNHLARLAEWLSVHLCTKWL